MPHNFPAGASQDTDFATLVFSNANYRYSYKEFEKALLQI